MRRLDRVVFFLLVVGILLSFFRGRVDQPEQRRPPARPPPVAAAGPPPAATPAPPTPVAGSPSFRPSLPAARPDDPLITVEGKPRTSDSVGTAFSIGLSGLWVTAAHVTESCRELLVVTDFKARRARLVQGVLEHERADVALLRTAGGGAILSRSARPLELGEAGYHFGYPQGNPGDARSELMLRARLSRDGRAEAGVLAWSEKERRPETLSSLGGMSGGPALDRDGRVVGVNVAASERRNHILTATVGSIDELLREAAVEWPTFERAPLDASKLNAAEFSSVGDGLREQVTVAQVICRYGPATGRRRGRL